MHVDGPTSTPPILLSSLPVTGSSTANKQHRLLDFNSAADAQILAALANTDGLAELPDEGLSADDSLITEVGGRTTAFVPLEVLSIEDSKISTVNVPVHRWVIRIVAGTATRIPVLDVRPSMLVADVIGPATFERLRALLVDLRGSVTRMLLAAWDQALTIAIDHCGGKSELADQLTKRGSSVGRAAVAEWNNTDRIGPRDPNDVARVGRIAGHPIVEQNSAAIAETMRQLRMLHQAVGRAIIASIAGGADTPDELEAFLGQDAVSIVNETVIYRVTKVGPVTDRNLNYDRELASSDGGS
jgi:hypothetical protein